MELELSRVANKQPMTGGIDLDRYEPPSNDNPDAESISALATAYMHLANRQINLTLLSHNFGKNAWLVHNSQLEAILRDLETELAAIKAECEAVNKERKGAQESVKGELTRLEKRWKEGIGRVLEVEMAAEEVRLEILRRRRELAGTSGM